MPDGYEDLIGSRATVLRAVTPLDTAAAVASGDVPVLATPRLIAWLESATVDALAGLPDGVTSVGSRIEIDHMQPSPIGTEVLCTAVVVGVAGRRIELAVTAHEYGEPPDVLLAAGTIVRAVVDRQQFLARAAASEY